MNLLSVFYVKMSILGRKPIVSESLKDLNNEILQSEPQSGHKMGHNQNLLRARTEVTNNSHLENNTALTSTEHKTLIISAPNNISLS